MRTCFGEDCQFTYSDSNVLLLQGNQTILAMEIDSKAPKSLDSHYACDILNQLFEKEICTHSIRRGRYANESSPHCPDVVTIKVISPVEA